MTSPPGISPTAYTKLCTLRRDFLAMTDAERLEFTEALRARRIKPPVKEKKLKEPKPPKPPKEPKETKLRAPRKKKEPAPECSSNPQ
jgi:hypothetical protein